jgi:hypothetical protein
MDKLLPLTLMLPELAPTNLQVEQEKVKCVVVFVEFIARLV